MKTDNPRRLAFESLKKCSKDGKYSNLEVLTSLSRANLNSKDKSLYTALVYGVLERCITLDSLLSRYSKLPLTKLDTEVLTALRLGLYQLIYMDKIPEFSACDESVKLVSHSSKGYVNAVLRAALKNKDEIASYLDSAPLDIKYSVPSWMIELWQKGYGEEKTLEILEGFLKKPPMTIRVNTLKTTPEALIEKLDGKKHPTLPDIIYASGNVESLYGFDEGLFFVQGSNSRSAVRSLDLKAGETVIDTCACPGGKSFSAAIDMENKGRLYSFDLHANKLSLVLKGADRLGIDIITAEVQNGTSPRAELIGSADAVICDVPCSGLGIIAKKPDIKYKKPDDIQRLPEIQYAILDASSQYIKKGGRLLYSTCTLNPDENERVTERFLEAHPDFHRKENFPKTSFPSELSDDGFFYDLLIKD